MKLKTVTSIEIGGIICNALGINANTVRKLVLVMEVGEVAYFDVTFYAGDTDIGKAIGELTALTKRYTLTEQVSE